MLGYWNDTNKTAEAIVDGWMYTGDLATMDEEGYVKIVGRSKDMVIRGGENIYPVEIETYLYRHPKSVTSKSWAYPTKNLVKSSPLGLSPKKTAT